MLTQAPRGTKDVLPADSYRWQYVESKMRQAAAEAGFREVRTPVFEPCIQYDVAFLELPLPCPLNVAADRAAFLFGHSREDCQEYFASGC